MYFSNNWIVLDVWESNLSSVKYKVVTRSNVSNRMSKRMNQNSMRFLIRLYWWWCSYCWYWLLMLFVCIQLHLTFFGVFARFWTVLVDYDCVLAVSWNGNLGRCSSHLLFDCSLSSCSEFWVRFVLFQRERENTCSRFENCIHRHVPCWVTSWSTHITCKIFSNISFALL